MTALDEYWELWLRLREDRGVEWGEYERVEGRMQILWHQMQWWEAQEVRRRMDDWYFKRSCEWDKDPNLVENN